MRARSRSLAYVQGFNAADAHRISARSLMVEDLGREGVRRVLPGYDELARRLHDRLPLRAVKLGTIATAVRWKPAEVEVVCRSTDGGALRRFRASRIVVSVPMSLLQSSAGAGQLRFEPALTSKSRALAH